MQEIGEIDEMANNGRYSKISRRIWNDEKVRRLSRPPPCGQSLFVRLLVGSELTIIPGVFQAWESGLAEAMGWSLKGFRKAFEEIVREDLARANWQTGFVFVPNAINHNEPPNPNVVLSWEDAWSELPECDLKAQAYDKLREWAISKGDSWLEAFDKACRKPSSKSFGNPCVKGMAKQEQEQYHEQEREQEQELFPATPNAKKPASRDKRPEIEMPSDWSPNETHRKFANDHGLDLVLEEVKFRGHFDGCRVKSWNGRFSTWLANSVAYARASGNTNQSWKSGAPKDKWGPGTGHGPQPNDPNRRIIPNTIEFTKEELESGKA